MFAAGHPSNGKVTVELLNQKEVYFYQVLRM